MPVASINKVMTLLLAFEAIDKGVASLDDMVQISDRAASMGGSQVYIEAHSSYKLGDLLKSIIVSSANDSCVAVAEYLAGSEEEMVARMISRAKGLGLENTNYVNSNGLPASGHYMSAYDIAMLSCELLEYEIFFQYSKIYSDRFVHPDGRVTSLTNTNKLVKNYNGCDGVKTGFTNEARYCLSCTAKHGDTRLVAVVLGEPTINQRTNDIVELLNYGFANYKTEILIHKNDIVKEKYKVWGGAQESIDLVCKDAIHHFKKKGTEQNITHNIEFEEQINAPIEKGQKLGTVKVMDGDILIGESDIVANQSMEKAGMGLCFKKCFRFFASRS
jgi:D-alanyl-D-alanine carboxypeptidase (penicillin-binding protein 5/6)